MLRYAVPVKVHPDPPKGQTVVCTRITIYPETGAVDYEFKAFDTDGVKVGDLHTAGVMGEGALAALVRVAYATAQVEIGAAGTVE